jgi:hypothetical protein
MLPDDEIVFTFHGTEVAETDTARHIGLSDGCIIIGTQISKRDSKTDEEPSMLSSLLSAMQTSNTDTFLQAFNAPGTPEAAATVPIPGRAAANLVSQEALNPSAESPGVLKWGSHDWVGHASK